MTVHGDSAREYNHGHSLVIMPGSIKKGHCLVMTSPGQTTKLVVGERNTDRLNPSTKWTQNQLDAASLVQNGTNGKQSRRLDSDPYCHLPLGSLFTTYTSVIPVIVAATEANI